MKPSERIHQLGEQLSGKENDPTRMLVGIIAYLDEKDRFENPDWKAECARIVKEIPGALSVSVRHGEDHNGTLSLFVLIGIEKYKEGVTLKLIRKVRDDLARFTDLVLYTEVVEAPAEVTA